MTTVRSILARHALLKRAYHAGRAEAAAALTAFSPEFLTRLRYRRAWGRWPHLESPATFDEKLLWLNFHWRHPLKAECGDKFGLRGYVERQGLGSLLPRLYAVYDSAEVISVEALPERFVLKCSHGCKCNVFCRAKSSLDWKIAKCNLDSWMRTDFSRLAGELHYGKMTPRIICEEFLQDDTGDELPTDYKVFCFGGRAYCTMVATARDPNGIAKLAFYDLEWKQKLPYCIPEFATEQEVPKPSAYEEMIASAQELSRPFPFVRVDYYSISGRAKLGEMTFTPGACVSADYMTDVGQQELGRRLDLPQPWLEPCRS